MSEKEQFWYQLAYVLLEAISTITVATFAFHNLALGILCWFAIQRLDGIREYLSKLVEAAHDLHFCDRCDGNDE